MSSSAKWVGTTGSLTELATSPVIEYAEKATKTRIYSGPMSLCESSILPRGTMGTGSESGFFVAKSTATRARGDIGTLTIVWEAGAGSGQPLPPDEHGLEPFEINPSVKKNAAFAMSGLSDSARRRNLDNVKQAVEAASDKERDDAWQWLIANGDAAALVLADLLRKGIETWYLAGLKYKWTQAVYTLPTLTRGSVIETPGGPLAGLLASGMDWIRAADDAQWNGIYWKVTRSWIGGPTGHWESVLYS